MAACRWGPPRRLTRTRRSATRFPCMPTFWSPIRRSQVSLSRGNTADLESRFHYQSASLKVYGLASMAALHKEEDRLLHSWSEPVRWGEAISFTTWRSFFPTRSRELQGNGEKAIRFSFVSSLAVRESLGVEFSDFFLLGGQATWFGAIPLFCTFLAPDHLPSINFYFRFLFVAQHHQGVVVHAVAVRRARREWQKLRLVDAVDVRQSTCCIRLRVKHPRHPDDASAEADSVHNHHAHPTLEVQQQVGLSALVDLISRLDWTLSRNCLKLLTLVTF